MSLRAKTAAVVGLALVVWGLTGCLPGRTYTYNVAARGPVVTDLGQFSDHVARTLADPRGWSLGGSLRFVRTDGPADFTIWLAAAASVPSFGPPCSVEWSCRAGRNVIINEDRWRGASAAWPYSLDSYQHFVVNHEVGHWLGFDHASCAGFGERAPVMAQQSKGGSQLGLCRFNVWPLPGERSAAGARHGVGVPPPDLPQPDDPFGVLDRLDVTRDDLGRPVSIRAVGWAIDGDTSDPLQVALVVDGRVLAWVPADQTRADLAGPFGRLGVNHGYDAAVDVPTNSSTACVVALGADAGLPLQQLGCRVVK